MLALVLAALDLPFLPAAADGPVPGSDVLVIERSAPLRLGPSARAAVGARLPEGSRLVVVGEKGDFLEARLADGPSDAASGLPAAGTAGFLAPAHAVVFPDGPEGTDAMLAVGRFLAATGSRRGAGTALLARACERLDAEGRADPLPLVALGEAVEKLAAAGGPLPPGLAATSRLVPGEDAPRLVPDGAPFARAVALLTERGAAPAALLDRARAGLLRARHPVPGQTLPELWEETAAWLALLDGATTPSVLSEAGDRLGEAGLALGRLLLAAGRLDLHAELEGRLGGVAAHLASRLPGGTDAARLAGRVAILRASRGDGTPPVPQRAGWGQGPAPFAVSIEGAPGALDLVVTRAGSSRVSRRLSVPVLPVPGSLRLSPDGRTAAWLELSTPRTIAPVIVPLEGDGARGDAALLAGGRPGRDRRRGHLVSRLLAFSPDGTRLGVALTAWDEVPPGAPRLAVLSTATAEPLVDASSLPGGRMRYREAMAAP